MLVFTRLLLLAALLLHVAPALAKNDLIIGMRQFPTGFHPLIETTVAKSYILAAANRPLTAFDRDWKPICLLCVSLPSLEADSAGQGASGGGTVRVTLAADARWADGVPVTTRDLLFTWTVGRDPLSGVANTEVFRRISAIDLLDAKNALLRFDRLTFDVTNLSDFTLLPEHLERDAFEADPKEYRNRTRYVREPTNPGLYLGPYVIAEIETGSHVVLKKNPRWWGKPPVFERITIRTIEDTAALVANLLSGDIDMIAGEAGIGVDQAEALESRYPDRFKVLYRLGTNFEHVDINFDNDTMKDVRVRHALLHGIDRDLIVRTLFGNRYRVAHSPVSPLDRIYAEDVPKVEFDPAKASRLLEEAGWRIGNDSLRRNEINQVLRLEILTTAGNRARESVLQVLQSQWRQIGIDLRIRSVPARVLFGNDLPKRSFGAMALYAYVVAPESVPRPTLHSEQIPSAHNSWAGYNFSGYRDSEMDGLIDKIEGALAFDRRRALWRKLQFRFAEQLPVLPLYFYSLAYVMPHWLEGIEPTGHNSYTPMWVEYWHDRRFTR